MNLDNNVFQQETSPMQSHLNVGSGVDCTIKELVETIAKVVGYQGDIVFDSSKPDGAPRKLMDVSRLESLGWKAKTDLETGLSVTYKWFLAQQSNYRR
jgi:GDP-L-fucose synthase